MSSLQHRPGSLPVIIVAVVSLGLCATGCVRQSEVFFEDMGALCTTPTGHTGPYDATMVFAAGESITFTVAYEQCLSSSCDINRQISCEVVTDGTQIVVQSQGSFTERGGNVSCTRDCGMLAAECTSEPLTAGDYVIVHGQDRIPLTIPSSVQGLCEVQFF